MFVRRVGVLFVSERSFGDRIIVSSLVCSSGYGGLVRCSISTISFGTVYGLRVGSTLLYPWFTSFVFTPVSIPLQAVYLSVVYSFLSLVEC